MPALNTHYIYDYRTNVRIVITVVRKIFEAFKGKVQIKDQKVHINLDMGIAVYPEDGKSTLELLRNSDKAMYKAKKNGTSFEFYFLNSN
ncbi:MAG: diguanylate cyclase [Victivallales bacterium]|nr:diguanylate cyclase [Victivallales bacterium]